MDLPVVSGPDMIWAASNLVVDVPWLRGGEPSDAVEHASWLFGDGIVTRLFRPFRNFRAVNPMALRFVTLVFCATLSFEVYADELTPEQKLILACFNLHVDDVVAALRDGTDVECTFGHGDAKLHFQDQWTGGWPAHALRWTPLQTLANSSPYPPPPVPYENNAQRITSAQRAQRDVDPAVIADRNQRRLAILRILLSNGCDIDVQDMRGASALYDAVSNRHIGMVKMLLRHGAEVNTKTGAYIDGPSDVTPLHVASRWSPTLSKLLIDHGADTSAVDSNNRTPEHYRLGSRPGVEDPFGDDGVADPFDERLPLHATEDG